VAFVGGCAGEPEGFRIRGRLVDAETGEPVSRESIYVHAFHDATHHQVTLDPESASTYEVEMPAAEVRLRIADKSRRYKLYEERYVFEPGTNEFDVRLEQTHFVLLHGRVLDKETGKPLERSEGLGRAARMHIDEVNGDYGSVTVPKADGSFSVRVPRSLLRIRFVNTAKTPADPALDLRGVDGDTCERDVLMD